MKKLAFTLAALLVTSICRGQVVNYSEYFIDDDPGFGMANPVVISSPSDDLTLEFDINTASLEHGFHIINFRARNDAGIWSLPFQQYFYVLETPEVADKEINYAEYFIDIDPGFEMATPISIPSPADDLTLQFTTETNSLATGFHIITVRTRSSANRWSLPFQQYFYAFKLPEPTENEVAHAEYFIDSDPGFGQGTAINIPSSANDITVSFDLDLENVSNGDHILYIRAQNGLGHWGHTYAQGFTSNLTALGEREIKPWFRLYPNPNRGNFIIEFEEIQDGPVRIAIYNLAGAIVYENTIDDNGWSISVDLPDDIYILEIETDDRHFKQQLVISE